MAMFNSYVKLPEGNTTAIFFYQGCPPCSWDAIGCHKSKSHDRQESIEINTVVLGAVVACCAQDWGPRGGQGGQALYECLVTV